MATDWPQFTVGELVNRGILERPIDGNHGSIHPKTGDFVGQGVPFIMASDLSERGIDLVNCSFITLEQAESLRKGFAKTGDVLLSHKATLGRTALVGQIPGNFIMLTPQVTYYRVRDPSALSSRFLKYYFDSPGFQQVLQSWAGAGSTRAYIGITDQLRLPIILPPLNQQNRIANILGSLDDKIVLNYQTSETLAALAQTLFKSWFVDFEPVYARIEGREPDLAPAVADLFPSSLQDSEVGQIPLGWRVLSLDEIAHFLNGLVLQEYPPVSESSLPTVKIAQLRSRNTTNADRASAEIPSKYVVNDGDVLFSWSASLECVLWCGGPGALNQHLFKVTSTAYPKWFYYLWIHQHLDEFRRIAAGKATTMGHIQRHHLRDAKVVVSDEGVLRFADSVLAPVISRVLSSSLQSKILGSIRDTLLPRLMSRELPAA